MDIQATATKLEKEEMRDEMLKRYYNDLMREGIRCEIINKTVQGMHKNEPFMVFIRWVHETQTKFVGVVVTRYKIKDAIGVPPVEVLKR